jgi:hypothetical protein
MIWSKTEGEVRRTAASLEMVGILSKSSLIHAKLEEQGYDLEPVQFFRVPRNARRNLGRLVTAFATINERGLLAHPSRGFYGVNSRAFDPKEFTDEALQLIDEAHAVGERTALTRGLFTINGRTSSELMVANSLPRYFQTKYIPERVDYLRVLEHEAQTDTELRTQQRELLCEELGRSIVALTERLG